MIGFESGPKRSTVVEPVVNSPTIASNTFAAVPVDCRYIDHVSGTVNWGKMMEEHPQFSAGHTNRQLATRWSQLKDELPSGE